MKGGKYEPSDFDGWDWCAGKANALLPEIKKHWLAELTGGGAAIVVDPRMPLNYAELRDSESNALLARIINLGPQNQCAK